MKNLIKRILQFNDIEVVRNSYMSNLKLIHGSCAEQAADVVVNAANSGLWEGSGICGVIFNKCGSKELAQECSKFQTPIKDGNAVITSACKMKNAKYIIHAVGPDFRITQTAFLELFNAYYNSLVLLKDNNLHSIVLNSKTFFIIFCKRIVSNCNMLLFKISIEYFKST